MSSSRPDDPVLRVDGLTFSYEDSAPPVLNMLSFELHERDAVLLLGPSGSGKSTLAFCLNGLYPDAVDGVLSGSVLLRGESLRTHDRAGISKRMGIVFQDPESQFCMVHVEDELAFGLENIGMEPAHMDTAIDRALALTGMSPYKKAKIQELSGGQKQKVALACVLAMEPELLILDEPTANLDPMSTREFAGLIGEIRRQRSLTLLIIEHKLDEWMSIADRTLVLNREGRMVFDGGPEECFGLHDSLLRSEGIWTPSVSQLGHDWKAQGIFTADRHPLTEETLLDGIGLPHQAADELLPMLRKTSAQPGTKAKPAPVLEAEHLACTLGGNPVLRGVDLCLFPGEIVAVAGANGAGKTTLLHALAGLLEGQVEGRVLLRGKPLASWPEHELRREIGLVFQNPEHQFVTGSVYDEVALSLRLQGYSGKTLEDRVEEMLRRFRLEHLAHENPFALSQGQKRRLSVAAMLVDEQRILLLDEPTFGQDAYTAGELMNMLEHYASRGNTAVFITHDMELVRRHADRVLLLQDGEVRFIGTGRDLWDGGRALLENARLVPPVPVSLLDRLMKRATDGREW